MEVRRAVDVLVRSQASPLSSFLNPAITSRWAPGNRFCYRVANKQVPRRSLASSTRNQAVRPHATTSAAPTYPRDSESPAKPSDNINEMSQSLWASRPSKSSATLDLEREKRMNGGNSANDLLAAFNAIKPPSSSTFDSSQMMDPMSDNRNLMRDMAAGALSMPQKPRAPMRLTPSTGRSVPVGTGIDVARGLRLLEQSCARNRVRADATQQRFHERGGLKRKRLRRQRWRRKFMDGFRATVARVKQLKHQGW